METDSIKQNLQKYLAIQKPFGQRIVSEIIQLTDGKSANHLNYKIITSDGVFVARITKPENLLSYANLADEFVILKFIEQHAIAPEALMIDLENFRYPVLFEEYIEGNTFTDITSGTEKMLSACMNLLVKTSEVKLNQSQFPFKFTYTTYATNFRAWEMRMKEIKKAFGSKQPFLREYSSVIYSAEKYLTTSDVILRSAKIEFIYNDIHPGNTFWLPKEQKAKFIDWQKVSLGDPAFMAALFARRFASIWETNGQNFAKKTLNLYNNIKKIENFTDLFYNRILERAVSDMIWEPWTALKRGLPITIKNPEENRYFNEAKECLKHL
jgi:thiamine kinase-like enzyme